MRLDFHHLRRTVLPLAVGLAPILLIVLMMLLFCANEPIIGTVAFSPDGTTLATSILVAGDVKRCHEVRVYDVKSGREQRNARRGFPPGPLQISSDSRSIAVHTPDGPLSTAELARWPNRVLCDGTRWSGTALLSPDLRTLATLVISGHDPCPWQGPVQLWNADTGRLRGTLGDSRSIAALAFSRDGQKLAAVAAEENLWDVLGSAPDAKTLAAAGAKLLIWDIDSGRELAVFGLDAARCVPPVALSPNATLVAATSVGGMLTIWSLTDGHVVGIIPNLVTEAVAFSPDGRRLAVAGSEAAEVWDISTMRRITRFNGHLQPRLITLSKRLDDSLSDVPEGLVANRIRTIAFSPDGRSVASGDSNGNIRIWDAKTGREQLLLAQRYEALESGDKWFYATAWLCAWAYVGLTALRASRTSIKE